MRQTCEPTVEEILQSNKKEIARDNRTGAAEERRQREFEGVAEPEEGLIEGEDEDVLDLAEDAVLDDEDEDTADRPLLTENAQSSMRESLAALALLSEPGAQPQIVRSGETSLEGLVRDLLRPALADWLDKNLPPLVERMVAAEIARIVSKRG
jgi:cell pole-organizing protein PopZ